MFDANERDHWMGKKGIQTRMALEGFRGGEPGRRSRKGQRSEMTEIPSVDRDSQLI